MDDSVWHKRFIWFGWCSPTLWCQTVWARKSGGKWLYQKTQVSLDLDKDMHIW
jgi:hypothetical protein